MSGQPDTVFASWYRTTIDEEAGRRYWVREPFWSEALAVGSEEWVGSLLPGVRNARMECVVPAGRATEVEESPGTYAAYAPKRSKEAFWQERMR
jgi:hypothetical protein